MRVTTSPVETKCGSPVVNDEDDGLGSWDDGGDEFVEIESMFNESICQMGKLVRCTHADKVRSNATGLVGDVGDYVAPEVRRSRITVEEQHNRLFLRRLLRRSVDICHLGIEDFNALEGEWEVGGDFFVSHIAEYLEI